MKPSRSLRSLADLRPGEHLGLLFETEVERRAGLAPFLRRGLELHEKVLYLDEAGGARLARRYLEDDGVEVEPYLASGQFSTGADDAHIFQLAAFLKRETARALAQGYPALRVAVDMAWMKEKLSGNPGLSEYEAGLNNFLPSSGCLVLCQYDRRCFEPALLLEILSRHPFILKGTKVLENICYLPPEAESGQEPGVARLSKWLDHLEERRQVLEELQRREQDLEERLAMEEALHREKEKYQTLAEKSPVGISIITEDGRYKYLNPKFVEIFGYTLADIPSGREWFARTFPDPALRRQVIANWLEDLRHSQPGELRPRTLAVTCKDGSRKTINFRAVSLENRDQVVIYEDITERLKAKEALLQEKERYRALVEEAPLGISILSQDGSYKYLNPKFVSMFGYTLADIPTGRAWFSLAYPDRKLRQRVIADWLEYLEECKTGEARPRSFTVHCNDGASKVIKFRAVLLTTGDQLIIYEDTSERVQAEEALRQSEARYRSLVEQIPAVVYVVTLKEPVALSYVSPQVEELLGFTPADFEADPELWRKQTHPEDRERVLAEVGRTQATGEPFVAEYRMLSKDGQTVWVHDAAWIVRDGGSQPLFLQGVVLDVSKRQELAEALKRSEEKYRLLVEQIPAAVFQGYGDWSIDCFDRKIENLTGYTKEDFNARRLRWRDLIPPEELDYVKQTLRDALAQPHRAYMREHRIRKKSGEYAWVQCRGQIFVDAEGKLDYISGVTFDITAHKQREQALKESEQRYRLLAENVTDVIWTANMALELTYVSPSIQLLRGFSPEEVMTQRLEDILTPASLELARDVLAEEIVLENLGKQSWRSRTMELELLCKDGSTVWTETKAGFVRDSTGTPVGLLGVTRDISKRKEIEEALRRREAVLEAMSFAAEKFLQAASWEEDIQEILARLGQAMQASRVYIFENFRGTDDAIFTRQRYEWVAPGVAPEIDNPELQAFPWRAAGYGRWEDTLGQGGLIIGHVREFPPCEQAFLADQGIKSIVVVPIFEGPYWWGMVGFDECRREREWTFSEIEALRAAASTLGAAILHERSKKALKASEKKLRSLSYQLLEAQESERRRLAGELHDELGHALLTLKIQLEALEMQLPPQQVAQKKMVKQILRFIGQTIGEVRRLYLDLSPGDLEDLGLTAALRMLVEDFAALQKDLSVQIDLDNLDGLLPVPVQTGIYRVVQEALTNIGKHAKAKQITFLVNKDKEKVSFIIEDDGKGFDAARVQATKKTLGLLAMEERVKILGGVFDLWSQKKHGARISFTIPRPKGEN
jgi:PAS domain S-box-containing protein